MIEHENIRDTLMRPWMDFQWARRDYLRRQRGSQRLDDPERSRLYEDMIRKWETWEAALYEQFGVDYVVEYEGTPYNGARTLMKGRDEMIVFDIITAVVMGTMYFGE